MLVLRKEDQISFYENSISEIINEMENDKIDMKNIDFSFSSLACRLAERMVKKCKGHFIAIDKEISYIKLYGCILRCVRDIRNSGINSMSPEFSKLLSRFLIREIVLSKIS